MCDMYRDSMSLVQENKTTITLKLKQVCATHSQYLHTDIAKVYTRTQSHMAAHLNRK